MQIADCRLQIEARHTRRGVLRAMFGSLLGLGFTALGCVTGLWAAAMARFMMPNASAESPQRFKVGFPADYPPDRVETRFHQKHGVWVVNGVYNGQRQIFALRTACTHLGCITTWQAAERRFKCPCHGSGFCANGVNFEGPAPARWSAAPSGWPKTANWRSTPAGPFRRNSASGTARTRSSLTVDSSQQTAEN